MMWFLMGLGKKISVKVLVQVVTYEGAGDSNMQGHLR